MCLRSVFPALRRVSYCYSALTSTNIYKSIESKAIEYHCFILAIQFHSMDVSSFLTIKQTHVNENND